MTLDSRWVRRVLIASVLFAAASCGGAGVINRGDLSLLSIDEEWRLGEQLAADIAREKRILDDPAIAGFVAAMGQTVVSQARGDTPLAQRPWTFHVIEDESLNAFNIPGGHVYLHSGLVLSAKNYAEVMGVMGHEVSHGLARHGVENLTKQYGIAMIVSLVLGENPEAYQELLAQVLAGGAVMKFSRSAESEADRLGVGYLLKAGVDPNGLVEFFNTLIETRESRPGAIEQFFSSHPLTEDRIAEVKALIEAAPARPLVRDHRDFVAFKNAVANAVPR